MANLELKIIQEILFLTNHSTFLAMNQNVGCSVLLHRGCNLQKKLEIKSKSFEHIVFSLLLSGKNKEVFKIKIFPQTSINRF